MSFPAIVTGPALRSHAQMAATVSSVTGREVHYHRMDVESFVPVLQRAGQPEWLARGVAELFEHMDTDVTDTVARFVAREPIGFEQFVREHVDAFSSATSTP